MKGYGVVRYLCRQVASQAKQELDGLNVNGVNIQVIHLFIFLILGEPILDLLFWFKGWLVAKLNHPVQISSQQMFVGGKSATSIQKLYSVQEDFFMHC